MNINIKALHFNIKNDDKNYVEEKIGHLEKYFKNIISAEVNVSCDHEDNVSNTYKMDVILKIPGKDLFAKTEKRGIREGIDELEEKLKLQISKHKEKHNPRRFRKTKEWVRSLLGREEQP